MESKESKQGESPNVSSAASLDHIQPQTKSIFSLLVDHVRIDDAVKAHTYDGEGTSQSPFVVDWIPEDAGNPMSWANSRRWTIAMVSAFTCFTVSFSSSAYTGRCQPFSSTRQWQSSACT